MSTPILQRVRLPDTRPAVTHKAESGAFEMYVTVGFWPDNSTVRSPTDPGEVFLSIGKHGGEISGMFEGLAQAVSVALQYGVPWEVYAEKFKGTRFGTGDRSLLDAFARAVDHCIETRRAEFKDRPLPLFYLQDEMRKIEIIPGSRLAEGYAVPSDNPEDWPKQKPTDPAPPPGYKVDRLVLLDVGTSESGPTLMQHLTSTSGQHSKWGEPFTRPCSRPEEPPEATGSPVPTPKPPPAPPPAAVHHPDLRAYATMIGGKRDSGVPRDMSGVLDIVYLPSGMIGGNPAEIRIGHRDKCEDASGNMIWVIGSLALTGPAYRRAPEFDTFSKASALQIKAPVVPFQGAVIENSTEAKQ